MSDGYDQNSEEINFIPSALVEDFSTKHVANMTKPMIHDLFVILEETFGDGFIQGFNLGVDDGNAHKNNMEWWNGQDEDEVWVDSHTWEDLEEFYGDKDLKYWQSLQDQLDEMNIIPGSAIGRKKDGYK
tara:strand:- start:1120 stop:1506 length:387 start_codon:yes stop_codon:yes gene_type:complete